MHNLHSLTHVLLILFRFPFLTSPLGLDFPSIAGSPHRLPSYYSPGPRTPAHRSELLVLVAVCAAARVTGSPLRPINDVGYWSLAVAGGRWSNQQLMAAEKVLHATLMDVIITDQGAADMRAEMEEVGESMGKLST